MNPSGATAYLVGTLIDLYVTAVLLRLLLQWVKADFYNPVCQFLVRLTQPALAPLRRLIPSIGSLDTASVVLMLGLEFIGLLIISQLTPVALGWPELLVFALTKILAMLLWTYFFLIIIMVILSWVGRSWRHPVVPLVYQLTEPVLRPIRRLLPAFGGIDLSPLLALIAIRFLQLLLGF